jgi:hypothetical protein
LGFLREFADTMSAVEDLALAGGDAGAVAPATKPEVLSFTWLLPGGVAAAGAHEVDINAWQAVWVDIFRATGFLANGCPAPRPEEPVTLYRGCGLGGQFGLAWTTDANTACLSVVGQFD